MFDIAGSSISWSSKKQPTVAVSTVESEYMASGEATKESIWLRVLLADMGFAQTTATVIHADNQGAIALSHNPVGHSRAKHIDIRHHFIRERIQNKEIELETALQRICWPIYSQNNCLGRHLRSLERLLEWEHLEIAQRVGVTKIMYFHFFLSRSIERLAISFVLECSARALTCTC